MPDFRLSYRSEEVSSEIFLDDLGEILDGHELDVTARHRIMMVLSEVFNNAMIHGNGCDPTKTVHVLLQVNDSTIHADIQDQGQGGLQRIRCKSDPTPLAENGRGIDLMEYYSSEIKYAQASDGGLKVSIDFDTSREKTDNASTICSTEDHHGDHN